MKTSKIPGSGISDFKQFIQENNYFVDKTLFIKDFITGNSYVSLMPRPKRFGKTLNLSMIEHFFDIQQPENIELFTDFEISKDKKFCKEHQNKYPVINITLKDIQGYDWNKCYDLLTEEISKLYRKHKYLLHSDKLDDFEKKDFTSITNREASQAQLSYSLQSLSGYLYKHFGEKVLILVDEYDAPIINAFINSPKHVNSKNNEQKTYYEQVVDFMQIFLGSAYKGNIYLKKGLLTGVMRISKESMFSNWNNVSVYDIKSNYFSDYFGFTEKETIEILTQFELQNKIEDVKKWYNGYRFGKTEKIYNPWSIIKYIANIEDGFKAYWINSSENNLIKNRFFEKNSIETIEKLISGQTIIKPIKENFSFDNFKNDNELLWTLLFYSGFLTQVKIIERDVFELRIPNKEIKIGFTDIILNWIKNEYNISSFSFKNTFINLINNNITEFEKGLRNIMQDSISYFDIGANYKINKEQLFHVYTLGLLAVLNDDYIIKSNRESGEGRYDIILIPKNKSKTGVIIEIKSIEPQKDNEDYNTFASRVNNTIEKAINQINKNNYNKELINNNIKTENIINLPIVFAGKKPFVKKQEIKNT